MRSSKFIAVLIAVIALLWIGSGLMSSDESEAKTPTEASQASEEKALMKVRVRSIEAVTYADEVEVTGRTQASRRVQLRAETTGQIQELLKEEGESVVKGDALAELEIRDRQARVTETKQRVNQRQIEYNAAKKLANKGFNSKVRLAQALADLENAKAEMKQAQIDLGKLKIIAPFDGTIFRQDIEAGDYLSVGDPLFTVVDLDPVELVGFVSERNVQSLELNGTARAEFLDGSILEGKLSYIAPAADQDTRTFRVIMSAENSDFQIKEGLTAKIKIPVEDKLAHRISPSILALNDAGQIGVKVVNDQNIVEFVPIKILSDKPDSMWILGVPGTARFITVGQNFVSIGQHVEPVEAEGDGLL